MLKVNCLVWIATTCVQIYAFLYTKVGAYLIEFGNCVDQRG